MNNAYEESKITWIAPITGYYKFKDDEPPIFLKKGQPIPDKWKFTGLDWNEVAL